MKKEAYGKFYVADHGLRPISDTSVFEKMPGAAIYEVVKIQQGTPIFFEEHMARFRKSAAFHNTEIQKPESEIRQEIDWLIERNRCDTINAKIVSMKTAGSDAFLVYFIPLEHPLQNPRTEGVHTILFPGERVSPNIKTLDDSFRDRVRGAREESGAFEALLTDENGFVTEGSRSNIFFVDPSGVFFTPPTERVLAGVTRAKVMEICKSFGIAVEKKLVHTSDLPKLAGAFITGTTVDVSPVGSIDNIRLDSVANPSINKIVGAYNKKVDEYVRASRSEN